MSDDTPDQDVSDHPEDSSVLAAGCAVGAQILTLGQVRTLQLSKPDGFPEKVHPWTVELKQGDQENTVILIGVVTVTDEQWFVSVAVMARIWLPDPDQWRLTEREAFNRTLTTLGRWACHPMWCFAALAARACTAGLVTSGGLEIPSLTPEPLFITWREGDDAPPGADIEAAAT